LVALANQEIIKDLVARGEQFGDVVDVAVRTDAAGPIGKGEVGHSRRSFIGAELAALRSGLLIKSRKRNVARFGRAGMRRLTTLLVG
jgi:hypothetical protein